MEIGETNSVAHETFREHVTDKGYDHNITIDELQAIILQSGASVMLAADAPPSFMGAQIGSTVFVNGTDAITEHKRRRILAHEWFHFLRRSSNNSALQTYMYSDEPHARDIEEQHAKEFERLF